MSLYVIDAGIAVKWFIEEQHSDKARILLVNYFRWIDDFIAPDLLIAEAANVLSQAEKCSSPEDILSGYGAVMIRAFYVFALCTVLLAVCVPGFGQAQAPGSDKWADYIAGDYDIVPNITYSTANNTDLKLDLYLPKNRSAPTTTLVLFHGGGWVDGQKERNVLFLLPYLSLGWAAINVEYRLARNSPAPAAVEDCRCALRWATYHAKEYNLDPSKFVLTGTSAGGHLALITGMLPPQTVFDRQCPTDSSTRWREGTEPQTKVAAIINWYGITDVRDLIDGPNAKHYAMEWFGSLNNRQELARQVSPINYVRAGLPPIITIHGESDDIVPYTQAAQLHAALDKAGVPNQLVTIRGRKHGGFNRQELVSSYSAIRDFLSKHNLLKPE